MNDHSLREYRLGRLTPEQRQEIEARAFEDDAFEDRLNEAGYDLLDDWARGALTTADRAAVERLFPAEELASARLIHSRKAAAASMKRPWAPLALAAAAMLLAVASSVYFWQQARSLDAQLRAAAANAPASRVVSLALHVPATRGTNVPILRIPSDAAVARITFALAPGYDLYEVKVESAAGGLIFSQLSQPGGGALELTMPASLLKPGNYEFLVSGVKDRTSTLVATYPCQIAIQ